MIRIARHGVAWYILRYQLYQWFLLMLVGGLVAINFIFPWLLGISSSQLTFIFFSEGWRKTINQDVIRFIAHRLSYYTTSQQLLLTFAVICLCHLEVYRHDQWASTKQPEKFGVAGCIVIPHSMEMLNGRRVINSGICAIFLNRPIYPRLDLTKKINKTWKETLI